MLPDDTRRKIKDIVGGTLLEGQQDTCTTIRNLLCGRFETSRTVKKDFESNRQIKEEQAKLLRQYSTTHHLWVSEVPQTYLARGGEARVYLDGTDHVIKVNDGVYYATWLEFFNSVLLHNLIFAYTAYHFVGFMAEKNILEAVLRQRYVKSDGEIDLADVKKVLEFNGFRNNKRHDYISEELGLILEDMHDENVLTQNDTPIFIDTVFYTIGGPPNISGS